MKSFTCSHNVFLSLLVNTLRKTSLKRKCTRHRPEFRSLNSAQTNYVQDDDLYRIPEILKYICYACEVLFGMRTRANTLSKITSFLHLHLRQCFPRHSPTLHHCRFHSLLRPTTTMQSPTTPVLLLVPWHAQEVVNLDVLRFDEANESFTKSVPWR